jgi:hypothetical protein
VPVLGDFHCVEVGYATKVSEVNTAVTFRVEVSKENECSCIHPTHFGAENILHFREAQTLNNKIKINTERP